MVMQMVGDGASRHPAAGGSNHASGNLTPQWTSSDPSVALARTSTCSTLTENSPTAEASDGATHVPLAKCTAGHGIVREECESRARQLPPWPYCRHAFGTTLTSRCCGIAATVPQHAGRLSLAGRTNQGPDGATSCHEFAQSRLRTKHDRCLANTVWYTDLSLQMALALTAEQLPS